MMSRVLSKTQNKDSVRENKNRTILLSIAQQMLALGESHEDIECKLNRILLRLGEAFSPLPGYGHENLMKLSSKLNISEDNCSMFSIRQDHISGVNKFKSTQVYAVESGKSF